MSRRKGRYERRKTRREENRLRRAATVGGLHDVFGYDDMYKAGKKCCNGVRWKNSTQRFEMHLFSGTARRRRLLLERKWIPGAYVHFTISERGKTRPIDAPRIQDRQVHKVYTKKVLLPFIRHYDVTGKLCPRPWCCADMNVYYKTSGDAQWEEFKKRISDGKEEDEDMTLDTFKELMKEYRAELQDNDCGTWSKEAREWAISNGLINGTGTEVNGEPNYAWADQLTREQAAALFYRFAKLMGKA